MNSFLSFYYKIKINFYLNVVLITFDNIIFEHPLNIPLILITLLVLNFEISGKDDNDEHSLNIKPILITLLVFHFEISGKNNNDEHPVKIALILITLLVFHFEISAKDDNDEHS